MIYLELPTNPNLTLVDLEEVIKITWEFNKDNLLFVDNNFLSPFNFKPLEHGVVDITIESCTKYINDIVILLWCDHYKSVALYE